MRFTFSSQYRMNELIEKANKVMAKKGLAPLTKGEMTERKGDAWTESGQRYTVVVYDVEIEIPEELVKFDGQEVVARLEDLEGQNMITRISDVEGVDLDEYRDAQIICQHCNTKRHRKGSWVVKSQDRGLIQVGDQCVDLYFGVDVQRILCTSQSIMTILEEERGPKGQPYYNFERFAGMVMWLTMTTGFITQKHAEEYATGSTRTEANYLSQPLHGLVEPKEAAEWRESNAKYEQWVEANHKDINVFDLALDFWMAKENCTEFEHNCRLALTSRNIKFLGLAAYAIKIYVDATYQAPKADKLKSGLPSNYVGEIKARINFTNLKVTSVHAIETSFGMTTKITFEDQNGNIIIWWASNDPQLSLGSTYNLKATVTKHEEYKNVKQTTINRAVVI
jgi:hypothetical protein